MRTNSTRAIYIATLVLLFFVFHLTSAAQPTAEKATATAGSMWVTGYYPILSHESNPLHMVPFLALFGVNVQPPRKIKDMKPVYPDGALPSRSQGAVVVDAVIGPDGKVQSVKVIHSVPGLDQAAVDAVRQWEYTPSLLNGVAVAVVMTVVVNFAMQ